VRADEVVATRHPSDGRFAIDLRLGAYRVSADVTGACWRGSRRDITLGRDGKHIRLTVDNVCIA